MSDYLCQRQLREPHTTWETACSYDLDPDFSLPIRQKASAASGREHCNICSAVIHILLSHFPSWEGLTFPVQVTTGLASPWLTWRCPVSCVLAPGLCCRSGPTLARYPAVPLGLGFQLTHCSSSPQTAASKKKKKHNDTENILCSLTWSVTPVLLPNIWPHYWLYPTNRSWKWMWPISGFICSKYL